jgi:hypothetical protein
VNIGKTNGADLRAVATLSAWGYSPKQARLRVSPCERAHCKGSVLAFGGFRSCLLCARDPWLRLQRGTGRRRKERKRRERP